MDPERTERRVWKQTIQAFAVDTWGMCDVHGGPFTSPIQYDDLDTMLAAHPENLARFSDCILPHGRRNMAQ